MEWHKPFAFPTRVFVFSRMVNGTAVSTHLFLTGPAFCEGILKQMKSSPVNQETP